MKIHIEINETDLKKLVYSYIQNQFSSDEIDEEALSDDKSH